jgi:hypothetical protein
VENILSLTKGKFVIKALKMRSQVSLKKFSSHKVSAAGIEPVNDKIKIIEQAILPTTVKGV